MLATFLAVSLSAVSNAGASRVRVRGGTSITATGTTGSRLVNHTGSQTLTCAAETATAGLREHITRTFPVTIGHAVVPGFTSCVLVPSVPVTVSCAQAKLDVTGLPAGAVVPGSIPGVACDIRLGTGTTNTCHVTTNNAITGGSNAAVTYDNGAHQLTVDQFHTVVGLTGSPSGCTLKNSTSARFQNSTGGNLVYNVSPQIRLDVS
jgi:hypothetical protein